MPTAGALAKRDKATLGQADSPEEVGACRDYPSILAVAPLPGELKACAQVRQLEERMATLDEEGFLGDVLAGPDDLSADERQRVEDEEGWFLDLRTGRRPPAGNT